MQPCLSSNKADAWKKQKHVWSWLQEPDVALTSHSSSHTHDINYLAIKRNAFIASVVFHFGFRKTWKHELLCPSYKCSATHALMYSACAAKWQLGQHEVSWLTALYLQSAVLLIQGIPPEIHHACCCRSYPAKRRHGWGEERTQDYILDIVLYVICKSCMGGEKRGKSRGGCSEKNVL